MSALVHSRPTRRALAALGVALSVWIFGLPMLTLGLAGFAGHWNGALPSQLTLAHLHAAVRGEQWRSLWHSLATALSATLASVLLGAWGALASRRAFSVAQRCIDVFYLVPVAIPSVSVGLALLVAFSRPPLVLNGTVTLVIVTHIVLISAYAYANVKAGIARLPAGLEEMASSLGAPPHMVLRRITLPLLLPQLAAAAALGFALSMGELGATLMLYPPGWATAPVEIFSLTDRGSVFTGAALSLWLLACTFLAIALLDGKRRRH